MVLNLGSICGVQWKEIREYEYLDFVMVIVLYGKAIHVKLPIADNL